MKSLKYNNKIKSIKIKFTTKFKNETFPGHLNVPFSSKRLLLQLFTIALFFFRILPYILINILHTFVYL